MFVLRLHHQVVFPIEWVCKQFVLKIIFATSAHYFMPSVDFQRSAFVLDPDSAFFKTVQPSDNHTIPLCG